MQRRKLGRTGIETCQVGLGCVTFGREIGEAASFEILDFAVENGITLLDTAEAYGNGASETVIGEWMRRSGTRAGVVLQTKVTTNFTREHVAEALARSLERLGTSYVDLYLMHSYDAAHPIEEALEALQAAAETGSIRFSGCSNFTVEQLRRANEAAARLGLRRLEVVQPVYNLLARGIEEEMLPYCAEQEIGVVTYSPLAAGFLTGKYSPGRAAIPAGTRFSVIPAHADIYFTPENFAKLDRLRAEADRTGRAMHEIAFEWALGNPFVDCVLAGATQTAHIANAVRAAGAGR